MGVAGADNLRTPAKAARTGGEQGKPGAARSAHRTGPHAVPPRGGAGHQRMLPSITRTGWRAIPAT
jgi:hypothetical protein